MMARYLMELSWLYQLPLWLNGTLFLILFLLAVETGFRSGLRTYRRLGKGGAARGDVTLTALLALLGLLLAFTYAFALSRTDQRKQAIIQETNAISTAFLRAGLAPEPARTELRRQLLRYARTRVFTAEVAASRQRLRETIEASLRAQAELWPVMKEVLKEDIPGPIQALIVASINDVLDVHTARLAAAFDKIPVVVLLMLTFVAALSLFMAAYNAGLQGKTLRWRVNAFAVVLAALILIIMDFDMQVRGLIQLNFEGLTTLIKEMERTLAQ